MNDPMLPFQWNYDNPGGGLFPDVAVKPEAGADIDLLDAWQLCTGSEEVIVAVIDEPVQTTHPDLRANIWSNPKNSQEHGYNFWDDTPNSTGSRSAGMTAIRNTRTTERMSQASSPP